MGLQPQTSSFICAATQEAATFARIKLILFLLTSNHLKNYLRLSQVCAQLIRAYYDF